MRLALRRHIGRAALAALLAVLTLAAPYGAAAHGEGAVVFQGTEGLFEVTVRVIPETPTVGLIHFTITPFDPETKALILEAEVDVTAVDPEGNEAYRARAVNSPIALEYYDANITIESAGVWTLRVDVLHEDRGSASFSLPLPVIGPALPASGAGGYVFLGVIVFLLGGAVYLWFRTNRLARRAAGAV